jgi:hypothetical protein
MMMTVTMKVMVTHQRDHATSAAGVGASNTRTGTKQQRNQLQQALALRPRAHPATATTTANIAGCGRGYSNTLEHLHKQARVLLDGVWWRMI